MKISVASCIFLVSTFCQVTFAQAPLESAPNEPPYTNVDDEFAKQTDDLLNEPVVTEPAPSPTSASTPSPAKLPARSAEVPPDPMKREVLVEDGNHRQYISHPMAKRGLQLIDRDGSYYYKPEYKTKREQSTSIKVGSMKPPGIVSSDGQTDYATMYGTANPVTVNFDYDWTPIKAFGSLGVQLGIGFFTAQGSGRYKNPSLNPGDTPQEKYTFYALPISVGGVYRFQYIDRQWLAPYVAGGGTVAALVEMRDDGKKPNVVASPAAYGAGGLLLNLGAFDRDTSFVLDSEYGIANLWLNFEVRQVQSTNKALDLSGTVFSAGLSFDY